VKRLSTWIFLLGAAATAVVLWTTSGERWGRMEEHVVAGGAVGEIGREKPMEISRLALRPLRDTPERQPLEVPREVFDQARDADQIQIRTRSLPVLGGDLIQYSLIRSGAVIVEWNEGWPFYGFTMAIYSFLGGGLLFALYRWIAAVFRFSPPSDS
jgi:hypothetical protein